MTTQFLRLFVILIVSLLLLAWSLDRVWQSFHGYEQNVITIGTLFEASSSNDSSIKLTELDEQDLAWPKALKQKLQQGETVQLADVSGDIFYYQLIKNRIKVIGPINAATKDSGYILTVSLFYFGFAVIILIWLWPLFKDLQKLRNAAIHFSEEAEWQTVNLSKSSMAYPMANTLNMMARRIAKVMDLQKELSRTVGHEIRTPLARIQFSLEILKSEPCAEELKCIEEDIQEIEELTDEFLQLARLEHYADELILTTVNPDSLILPLIERLQHNSTIAINYHNLGVNQLAIEKKSFLRLLQNLLTNGLKYSNTQVTVELARENNINILTVSDDGSGFANSEQAKTPFIQEDGTVVGYGLGLAIVQLIANWYHGQMIISRCENLKGAKIEIRWPDST